MNNITNIVFLSSSLGAGGAENVLVHLAKKFAKDNFDVHIVTMSGDDAFYEVDPEITVHKLNVSGDSGNIFGAITKNIHRVLTVREKLKEISPDVMVSFGTETNILAILSSIRLGIRAVVSERCDPRFYPVSYIWSILRMLFYPLVNALVAQTQTAADYFWYLPKSKIQIIANPARKPAIAGRDIAVEKPFVLGVGRLVRQKGFDLLLEAFAKVADDLPGHTLVLLGDGPNRQALEGMASRLGIGGRVAMPGVVTNVSDYMDKAEIFVLPSRFEGFPNVLVEAMAIGKAVIATDCHSGPGEIINNGVNGLLVPVEGVLELESAMRKLINDDSLRATMGEAAKQVSETYADDEIYAKWKQVILHEK